MRITQAHLENLTDWINHEKGYPLTAYERDADGILHAQQLHIMVRRYSGRCHVEQIVNAGGGVRDLNHGTDGSATSSYVVCRRLSCLTRGLRGMRHDKGKFILYTSRNRRVRPCDGNGWFDCLGLRV